MINGLFARLAWGFAIGLLLLHVGNGLFHAHDTLIQQAANFTKAQVDRLLLIDELTNADPQLLQRLSDENFEVAGARTSPTSPSNKWRHQEEVHELVVPYLRELGLSDTQARYWFRFGPGGPRLQMALKRGYTSTRPLGANQPQWLVAQVQADPARWRLHFVTLVWTTLFALLVLGGVLWVTRRATRILPMLATAAEKVGSFGATEPLPVSGPKEVRRVSRAFNQMQERLRQHERERGAMLGAFSHDIRTLITRVTLRIEPLVHNQDKAKLEADLNAITHIVDEALAYSKDEVSDEPRTKIDLHSLLQTLVDDLPEARLADVDERLVLVGQPQALRRALLNLLQNAVLYGERALVSWRRISHGGSDSVLIDIQDAGPGIPEADQQRVLEPYVRLERSRNRATGGSGLGLAIAHNVVRRHQGSLEFARDEAGFHVLIALPLTL